jgi:hypothetical protein
MVTALIATLAVFLATGAAGAIARARLHRPTVRGIALVAGLLLALPCASFAAYYLHWWDEPILLYRFRALPGSELAAGLSGLLAGWWAHLLAHDHRRAVRMATLLLAVFPLLLVIPYLKPLLSPLDLEHLGDHWQDGICLQTSGSTCGPSCAATLLKAQGRLVSERSMAEAARTTASGTECWYLIRAMRQEGMDVSLITTEANPPRLPWPAIAGTRIGERAGVGHFITVLGETAKGYVIGDPLRGRLELAREEIGTTRWFTGFFITVDGPPR